jgi:hypothetical protein
MNDTPDLPFLSPAFAEHLQQPMPEFLYHYTNQDGLLGIVSSGSLWATRMTYLNDATEYALPLRIIRERLSDELQNKEMEPAPSTAIDTVRTNRINQRKERAAAFCRLTTEMNCNICVTSFCKTGDLLSQWRGYAGGGYGYSLGFIPSKLKTIACDSGFILGKCIYDPDLQKQIIAEGVEYLLTKPASPKVEATDYFWYVMTCAAFFKDPSFEQEQEWRLVSHDAVRVILKACFRKGKSMIIPYISIPINSAENLAIDHVFVGPCQHMELSRESVDDMLFRNEIADVTVKPSSIPFRDW